MTVVVWGRMRQPRQGQPGAGDAGEPAAGQGGVGGVLAQLKNSLDGASAGGLLSGGLSVDQSPAGRVGLLRAGQDYLGTGSDPHAGGRPQRRGS